MRRLQITPSDANTQSIVLGIVLGTSLGFTADLFKRSIDDFRKKSQIRSVAKTLLAHDALSIFRTMELYRRALADPNLPEDIKKGGLPPGLDLHYWEFLSSDKEFILLASEEPFSGYYRRMWDFEKLNKFRVEGESEMHDEQYKNKPPPVINI